MRVAPFVVALILADVMSGCVASGKPGPQGSAGPPASATTGAATVAPSRPTIQLGSSDLLVARRVSGSGASLDVIDGGNGRVLFTLPAGLAAHDWRAIYTAAVIGATTRVQAFDPNSQGVMNEFAIDGAWRLPTIGVKRALSGLSADGSRLVLEEDAAGSSSSRARTRFAVVATSGIPGPRVISLPGSLSFDALSPDGTRMFVIEHLAGGADHYDVRAVDLGVGKLLDGVIVDKRNIGEQMAGYAITQLLAAGWAYTVYRGDEGAFIHALSTVDGGTAFCVDLPETASEDDAAAAGWSLALDPTGHDLYAANGPLRLVSKVNLENFAVVRTALLTASAGFVLAKFGHGPSAAGGGSAVSRDGGTLYVADGNGIAVVRSSDLEATGRLGSGAYASVAIGPTGALYAIDSAGRLVRIDATTGQLTTTLGGGGYSQIEAVAAG